MTIEDIYIPQIEKPWKSDTVFKKRLKIVLSSLNLNEITFDNALDLN